MHMVQTSSTNWSVFAALKPNAQSQFRWGQVQRSKGREVELKGVVFRDESLSIIDQFFGACVELDLVCLSRI